MGISSSNNKKKRFSKIRQTCFFIPFQKPLILLRSFETKTRLCGKQLPIKEEGLMRTLIIFSSHHNILQILTNTGIGFPEVSSRILVMQRPTLFALAANSIVYTVNTDSSTNITRGRKHSRVKSTLFCMAITVTL